MSGIGFIMWGRGKDVAGSGCGSKRGSGRQDWIRSVGAEPKEAPVSSPRRKTKEKLALDDVGE